MTRAVLVATLVVLIHTAAPLPAQLPPSIKIGDRLRITEASGRVATGTLLAGVAGTPPLRGLVSGETTSSPEGPMTATAASTRSPAARTLLNDTLSLAVATLGLALAAPAPAQTTLASLEYREGHREAAIARRAELRRRMEGGLAVIISADRSQPNLFEFYTPDTESHDFLFLTGIYDAAPPGSVLVLNPGGATYREILYTDLDAAEARGLSGIEHVFPR
ncbi:MAG: hypothetical protein FJX74_25290, partial [Armatimonadetes bacterium]|nr:hypothetical protein [Armatimonadota bacterium]